MGINKPIRVDPQAMPPPVNSPPKLSNTIIVLTVLGVVVSIGMALAAIYWKFFSKRCGEQESAREQQKEESMEAPGHHGATMEKLSLADLSLATSGFTDQSKIGSGSFGHVFLGRLANNRQVAIKRGYARNVNKQLENEIAFRNELSFLTRIHHRNVISLIGFCEEDDERILVYDYMEHGSLYEHLHTEVISPPWDSWAFRIKIALDVARGLNYLHNFALPPIIHRDIKSKNILLDRTWNARISDFGLSVQAPMDANTSFFISPAGTRHYLDPEYETSKLLTGQSDVFSFGVVLLELITGKMPFYKDNKGSRGLIQFSVPFILNQHLGAILDNRVPVLQQDEFDALKDMASMARRCVNLESRFRPSMVEVVTSFENLHASLLNPINVNN